MFVARPRRVTSVDVARESGVSRTTVSYVLNGTPGQTIPEETRRRVLDAAARLGYVPSAAARALRSGRSELVLLMLPNWPVGHNLGTLIDNLSSRLAQHDLTLVTHHEGASRRDPAELWRTIAPAAVIVARTDELDGREEAAMRAAGIQVVHTTLESATHRPGVLPGSQERVGRIQAEHLAAAGHRRLGYAYPDDERVASFARLRLAGVRRACAELDIDPPLLATVGMDGESGPAAVGAWRDAGVTGVCAYNDEYAFPLLAGIRAHKLRVPDDLAVVGVDNIPLAEFADPPLTTVEVNMRTHTMQLVSAVLRALSGQEPPAVPVHQDVKLVLRASA